MKSLRWASGLLVLFLAFGVASFISGAAAWGADGVGLRSPAVVFAGQAGWGVGFAAAVVAALIWHRGRCLRGRGELAWRHVLSAMLALPCGAITWAIFIDAIAWHRKADIVRQPVDYTIMYVVLTTAIPITLIVPLLVRRWSDDQSAPTSDGPALLVAAE